MFKQYKVKVDKNHRPYVRLTFESNADTTVPVYYTKESFVSGTPDETISLKANECKTTTINKPEIYRFGVTDYDPNTLIFRGANTAITFAGVKGTVLDGYRLFDRATNLKEVDLTYLDTSKMTNMHAMFYGCSALTTLDVSKFDTSKVTNMSDMFNSCLNLTTPDLSKFDTSKVTNMHAMFQDCSNLTTLDVSKFDTSNVTDMSDMFFFCPNLITLDVSNWNTSNVTDMSDMFYNCLNLTTLDVSKFDTSNVTDMSYMFYDCSALTTIGKVDTASGWQHKPDIYDYIFDNCPATPKPSWYK